MTQTEFAVWCQSGIHLLDGATGSNLIKAGMPRGVCSEEWILEHPEPLMQLQRAYVEAGSEIVYAPTFCANRTALSGYGKEDRLQQINMGLVKLTREAVGKGVLVAGDMTTLGQPLSEDDAAYDAVLQVYREQAQALLDAGVDLFAVETMMGVRETMAAVEAIRSVCALPILCTLSVQSDGMCYFDGTAEQAAAIVEALGADAVGVNCSAGPDQLESVIRTMKNACTLPVVAKPNAGMPAMLETGEAVYSMEAAAFVRHMVPLVRAGATLLGGCCGTDAQYIRAMRETFKS